MEEIKFAQNWLVGFAGWRSKPFLCYDNSGCRQTIRVSKFRNLEEIKFAQSWLETAVVHFVPVFLLSRGSVLVLGKAAEPWWIRFLGAEQDLNNQNPFWCFVLGVSTHTVGIKQNCSEFICTSLGDLWGKF